MIEAAFRKQLGQLSLEAVMSDSGFICLAGRNGAGKTTLLRVLAGLLEPDSGQVKIDGRDVTRLPVERRGVVLVTPESTLPSMEVDAHLRWGARLGGKQVGSEELSEVKRELGIDFGGRAGKLSLGMRERVSLATALLSGAKVVLVDEAFSNLHGREGFISSYRGLAEARGIDVVFSTQDESDGRLAQHLYVIEEGKLARRF